MSETAQETILQRIRDALAHALDAPPALRAYRHQDTRAHDTILAQLIERLEDYKAHVTRATIATLPDAIAAACAHYGIRTLAVPADLPADWLPCDIEARRDSPALSNGDLVDCDSVLTGCAVAIAQTGTLVLNGGARQGRRALSLVPDRHICVVMAEQVVGLVPEGIAQLATDPAKPMTFISGPSATSDIELSRVEGVHGPRTLHVILCG